MITVITPVYNNVSTIERTINSVLAQKDESIEYIIVDGMSNDGTIDIIKKYEHLIDVFISEKDKGISDAYNKGIQNAKGDLILIVAADDRLVPGCLKKIQQLYDKHSDVVLGNCLVDVGTGRLRVWKPNPDLSILKYDMCVPHPSMLVRKDAYMRYGMYSLDFKCAMDHELTLRFYLNGAKFQNIDIYINIFTGIGGISSTQVKLALDEDLRIAKLYGISENEWNAFVEKRDKVSIKKIVKTTIMRFVPSFLKNIFAKKSNTHILESDISSLYMG